MLKTALIVGMVLGTMSNQASTLEGTNPALLARVDHLVYATLDLDRGISEIETMLGVKASPGGQHPGRGTRNALVSLGPTAYLEIFAPDPTQQSLKVPRAFGLDNLKSSRLVVWYVKSDDLDRTRSEAVRAGVPLGEIRSGSRRRSDGVEISWRFTDPLVLVADGIVPLFIDWGRSPHPSESTARRASLIALRAEHPDAARVRLMLQKLGIDLPIVPGPTPALIAVIDCPKGRVVLR